ncbi:hypothetical protein [Chitinophaga nivalis]|uniref:Lipoprotein n=1 Tax=Chitinophaga nivalis TaxID=2991709 RepID=A0ABT3IMJ0_9BACT|nr:hypothetical protein [Chitinophaga nivalis]MCW3465117.1 hypothetical protein [Chitinophaga nivalis]MCW3485191.1 hypothetical protein [Chitinophaga nivalis]
MRQTIILPLLLCCLCSGCALLGFYTTDSEGNRVANKDAGISIPTNIKKKKRKIAPAMAFIEAIKDYRLRFHRFPQDLWSLENASDKSRNAFRYMKEMGFKKLELEYVYLDSMVIAFAHVPVYNQKIGTTTFDGMDVNGQFIFTYGKDSSFSYIKKLK